MIVFFSQVACVPSGTSVEKKQWSVNIGFEGYAKRETSANFFMNMT